MRGCEVREKEGKERRYEVEERDAESSGLDKHRREESQDLSIHETQSKAVSQRDKIILIRFMVKYHRIIENWRGSATVTSRLNSGNKCILL